MTFEAATEPRSIQVYNEIAALTQEIHPENVRCGWWGYLVSDLGIEQKRLLTIKKVLLIGTEIAEMIEGDRKSLPDDHLPQYPMELVELADTYLRAADILGFSANATGKGLYMPTPEYVADIIQVLTEPQVDIDLERTSAWGMMFVTVGEATPHVFFDAEELCNSMLKIIVMVARLAYAYELKFGIKLLDVIRAKRAYNLVRADHKPEARAAAGGKAY